MLNCMKGVQELERHQVMRMRDELHGQTCNLIQHIDANAVRITSSLLAVLNTEKMERGRVLQEQQIQES